MLARETDNGSGFDLNVGEAQGSGLGLGGMRERALIVGGSLEIDSAPGSGAVVTFSVEVEERL